MELICAIAVAVIVVGTVLILAIVLLLHQHLRIRQIRHESQLSMPPTKRLTLQRGRVVPATRSIMSSIRSRWRREARIHSGPAPNFTQWSRADALHTLEANTHVNDNVRTLYERRFRLRPSERTALLSTQTMPPSANLQHASRNASALPAPEMQERSANEPAHQPLSLAHVDLISKPTPVLIHPGAARLPLRQDWESSWQIQNSQAGSYDADDPASRRPSDSSGSLQSTDLPVSRYFLDSQQRLRLDQAKMEADNESASQQSRSSSRRDSC